MTDEELNIIQKNSDRYIALRDVLITPGLDDGFFHTPNPGTAEGIDAAVDRLINFLIIKRRGQL